MDQISLKSGGINAVSWPINGKKGVSRSIKALFCDMLFLESNAGTSETNVCSNEEPYYAIGRGF